MLRKADTHRVRPEQPTTRPAQTHGAWSPTWTSSSEVTGRGPRALWAIYTHMLRELAQHCGHAGILREQVLAERD